MAAGALPNARLTAPRNVRAAVVQAASVAFDRDGTLDRVEALAARSAAEGAELVVFPEAFVSGYPKGVSFGATVGIRARGGRDWFRRYHESGVDIPGPAVDRLAGIARRHAIHLVIGVIERDGGTLYCTVLFLGPDGSLLGTHRKVMPTAMERLIWGFGDGSTLTVVPTPLGMEVRAAMASKLARVPVAIERLSAEDQRLLRDVLARASENSG